MNLRHGLRCVAVAVALAVSFRANAVAAQPEREKTDAGVPARLEYAGSDCATPEMIESLVLRRSTRIRFVDSPDAQQVSVAVKPPQATHPWRAHIVVRTQGRVDTVRALDANSCESLVDATGFVIAVALDPPSAMAQPELPARITPLPGQAPPATDEARRGIEHAASAETPSMAEAQSPGAPRKASDVTPRKASRTSADLESELHRDRPPAGDGVSTTHAVGLGVSVVSAAAPDPVAGGAAFWLVSQRHVGSGLTLSPELRVTVAHHRGSGYGDSDGKAAFRLTNASVELCPLNLGDAGWGTRPCALFVGGLLDAQGSDTIDAERHARPWAVLGGSLSLHGELGARLRLVLDVGAGATLVRDEFLFDPHLLHRVPSWSATATGGLAVALP